MKSIGENKDIPKWRQVTVITCSDSRVPVEHIFDAGIMDIFVIRVAGNVCDVDERGSKERYPWNGNKGSPIKGQVKIPQMCSKNRL